MPGTTSERAGDIFAYALIVPARTWGSAAAACTTRRSMWPARMSCIAGPAPLYGTKSIVAPVLAWLHSPEEDFRRAADAGIDVGISSLAQLEDAADAGRDVARLAVHIKLETGLSRNGVAEEEWGSVF